jgi:hypothetical protein
MTIASLSGGAAGSWGGIGGTLSAQSDLQAALDLKADNLDPVTITTNTNLLAASHANRTIFVTGTGIVLTVNNDSTSGASSDEIYYAVPTGTSTFSIAAGTATFEATRSTTLDNATSVSGALCVQRTGTDLYKSLSANAATNVLHHYSSARVADIATGSTTETVAYTLTLPALRANDEVEVQWFYSGSGTAGAKAWSLRLGGTGINGTVVANFSAAAANFDGRCSLSFANIANAAVQYGLNGVNGFGVVAASRAGAVDTSTATALYLTLTKSTGADVINLEAAKTYVKRTY